MRIYLDMDGVCCNFDKSAQKAVGAPEGFDVKHWDWYEDIGLTLEEFWCRINALGEDFWSGLEDYVWFEHLYKELKKRGDVYFCSHVARSPWAYSGRIKWLQKRFGERFDRFIFTAHKPLLAAKDTVLVDDNNDNCNAFQDAGGYSLLFPQPWNNNASLTYSRIPLTLSALDYRIMCQSCS